jgi:hypothetical protein
MAIVIYLGISEPPDNASIQGPNLTVSVDAYAAYDDGREAELPVKVTISVTGENSKTKIVNGGWDAVFENVGLGRKTIKAVASKAGAASVAVTRHVTVFAPEFNPPDLSITQPNEGHTVEGAGPTYDVRIAGTASDQSAIARVEYRLGSSGIYQPVDKVSGDKKSWKWTKVVSGLSLGPNIVYVRAIDQYGNTSPEMSRTITCVDIGRPEIKITSPATSPFRVAWSQGGVSVNIAGTASDPTSSVQMVEWRMDGGEWKGAVNDSGTWSNWRLIVNIPAPGLYYIEIRAKDKKGNAKTASLQIDIADLSFPENLFNFRISLLRYSDGRYVGEFEGVGALLSWAKREYPSDDPNKAATGHTLTLYLEMIQQIIDAENSLLEADGKLINFNPGGALALYTAAVNSLNPADVISTYGLIRTQRGPGDEIPELLDLQDLIEQIHQLWNTPYQDETHLHDRLSDYEKYKNYNPFNVQNSLEELQFLLPNAFGEFRGEFRYRSQGPSDVSPGFNDNYIFSIFNDVAASILHYSHYIIPLSIAEALSESGQYLKANIFYQWIYDPELNSGYPYLNPYVDTPYLNVRMGANLLEWAESLYREDTTESINRAKYLYGRVLELHRRCSSSSEDQSISCNPVTQAQVEKVRIRLAQINGSFNILGYRDDMVPILRYPYLVNQAKMFAQLAIQAEKDFIQFLTNAEQESFNLLTAQQALAIAKANVRVEQARAGVAKQRIELAKLQKDQLTQEIKFLKDDLAEANAGIFKKAEWAQASDEYASTFTVFGMSGQLANQFHGGWLGGAMQKVAWNSASVIEEGRDYAVVGGNKIDPKFGKFVGNFFWSGGEPPTATRRKAAAQARKNQINKLTRQISLFETHGLPIAQQQIDIAVAEHEVAQRQIAIAQLQVEHAQQILSFLQTKFLNKELWYELAKEVRAIYRKLLDYAIATAFLAEQALEYEMNQQLNVIRFDYYKPGRQGLLGAETLQADIATLEYQRVVLTENKRLPVKAVISLGEEYPLELLRFTSNGKAHFATNFRQFDLLYPGAYQSRISRVEVVIEGLIPPEGVHGMLSTSGVSYVHTRENQIQPLAGNPETMILSSYTIRGDQVVFYKTGEELELFEGLGVVMDWTLEMPKAANNMNYQAISDVKLVIYYSALFDNDLRDLVKLRGPKGGDSYQGFSMRFQFPDGFYQFNNNFTKALFSVEKEKSIPDLDASPGKLSPDIENGFKCCVISLSNPTVNKQTDRNNGWIITGSDNGQSQEFIVQLRGETLDIYEKDSVKFRATLTFETSDAYFPTNQDHRRIANINIVMVSNTKLLPGPGQSLPFTLCSTPVNGEPPITVSDEFEVQPDYNHIRASSNVEVLKDDGTPEPAKALNVLADLDMNRKWELQLPLDPNDEKIPDLFFKKDESGERVPDLSKIVDVLFFVEYTYDRTDLTIVEHFDKDAAQWVPVDSSQWKCENGVYQATVNGEAEARSLMNIDSSLEKTLQDNVMISFRTKVSNLTGNGNNGIGDNDSRFYFADGYYLLSVGREGKDTHLWKLTSPFDFNGDKRELKDARPPEQVQKFFLEPDRWYTIEVGKFRDHIDVSIDGTQVFEGSDSERKDGAGIAVGTAGTGQGYFDDILI